MSTQTTDTILMIRPVRFEFNIQTAVNNYYQQNTASEDNRKTQQKALLEFDRFVLKLQKEGVHVIVVDDTLNPHTPDSIFPNNWVSFHYDGSVLFYPMFAKNRRQERQEDLITLLQKEHKLYVSQKIDLSDWEDQNLFLEGTGSLVLDRVNKIAYGALSERTNEEVVEQFVDNLEYSSVLFTAKQTVDKLRLPIYHTNVMMCVADKFVVVCLDAIDDVNERQNLIESFEYFDKEIIEISEEQVNHFAGNMLQVHSKAGEKLMVMSTTAFNSLNQNQIEAISKYSRIIHSSLTTIETQGGGSARCMMAEVFLLKKNN